MIKAAIVELGFTELERERLRLMHNYTLHTSKSITEVTIPGDRDHSIWNHWVTELALENDFLLHGLLSLSALHLALRGASPEKYTMSAIRHHLHGIALFRPCLSAIPDHNYDAAFAFSCMVALYSFGILRPTKPDESTIIRVHQVLTLVRSSSSLVKANQQANQRSLSSMLILPIHRLSMQPLPTELENTLSKLLQRASTTVFPTMYVSAIGTLRITLAVAICYPGAMLTLSLFPVMTPAEFWPGVVARDPLALAVLANYAVVLYWLRGNIWINGWGKETINAVQEALPSEWQDCIAWAVGETEPP